MDDFQKRKASKDGLTSSCKICLSNRDKERYPKEKENRKELCKRYSQTKEGKKSHSESVRKWRSLNERKRACHVILNNAVRDGRLIPLPCFICGIKAEAHHPDYDQPLSVVWLCPSHHKQAHALVKK